RSDDAETRAEILEARREWPSLPRHVGTWEFDDGGAACMCQSCARLLCGIQTTGQYADQTDPRARFYTWHIDTLREHPLAFADEVLCENCERALIARLRGRTREALLASEWNVQNRWR